MAGDGSADSRAWASERREFGATAREEDLDARISAEQAFADLARQSQNTNAKLRELAASVVAGARRLPRSD
jgi:hypothetical protein